MAITRVAAKRLKAEPRAPVRDASSATKSARVNKKAKAQPSPPNSLESDQEDNRMSKAGKHTSDHNTAQQAFQSDIGPSTPDSTVQPSPGTDHPNSPEPTFTGLPPEIRLKILRRLLVSDQAFIDVPLALAPHDSVDKPYYHERTPDSLLDSNGDIKQIWARWPRYPRIYPQILATCEKARQEGTPLLYNNAVIGACVVVNFQFSARPYTYQHLAYCMGMLGVRSALFRYPQLRNVKRWVYRIYIKPGDDTDRIDKWYKDCLHDDIDALLDLVGPLRSLDIRLYNTAIDGLQCPDRPRQLLMPFHHLQCEVLAVTEPRSEGRPALLTNAVALELHKYARHTPCRPIHESWHDLFHTLRQYGTLYRRCPSCHPAEWDYPTGLRNQSHRLEFPQLWAISHPVVQLIVTVLPTAVRDDDVDIFYDSAKLLAQEIQNSAIDTVFNVCHHARAKQEVPVWVQQNAAMLAEMTTELQAWYDELPTPV